MSTTLTSVLIHTTFSTKRREPTLPLDLLPDLFQYMGGVCRDMKSVLMHAGGVEDHVHLLINLGKTSSCADLLMHIKRSSSMWVKNQRPGLHSFGWQDGYFCFSVGHDGIPAVRTYFDGQVEHHRKAKFTEEVEAFLAKYQVAYEPKYLWTD